MTAINLSQLMGRGIEVVIPPRSNRKNFRRVATRYEKLAKTYLAMVTIAAVFVWLA
jgi:transposase